MWSRCAPSSVSPTSCPAPQAWSSQVVASPSSSEVPNYPKLEPSCPSMTSPYLSQSPCRKHESWPLGHCRANPISKQVEHSQSKCPDSALLESNTRIEVENRRASESKIGNFRWI